MEHLARCIIRTSFSLERMTYMPNEPKMVYRAKDGKDEKTSASFTEKPNTILLLASGVVGLVGLRKKYCKS
jgi:hypothetical protein